MAFIPIEETSRSKSTSNSPSLSPKDESSSSNQQKNESKESQKIYRLYAPGKFSLLFLIFEIDVCCLLFFLSVILFFFQPSCMCHIFIGND